MIILELRNQPCVKLGALRPSRSAERIGLARELRGRGFEHERTCSEGRPFLEQRRVDGVGERRVATALAGRDLHTGPEHTLGAERSEDAIESAEIAIDENLVALRRVRQRVDAERGETLRGDDGGSAVEDGGASGETISGQCSPRSLVGDKIMSPYGDLQASFSRALLDVWRDRRTGAK